MPTSPSIVPHVADQDTYLVVDDFGWIGCVWRETDVGSTDLETLIRALAHGEFNKPVRIVAFNIAQGWCRDATADIADELRRRYVDFGEMPDSTLDFMDANADVAPAPSSHQANDRLDSPVTVGDTALVLPAKKAARAPSKSATAANSAPRETALVVTSAACFAFSLACPTV